MEKDNHSDNCLPPRGLKEGKMCIDDSCTCVNLYLTRTIPKGYFRSVDKLPREEEVLREGVQTCGGQTSPYFSRTLTRLKKTTIRPRFTYIGCVEESSFRAHQNRYKCYREKKPGFGKLIEEWYWNIKIKGRNEIGTCMEVEFKRENGRVKSRVRSLDQKNKRELCKLFNITDVYEIAEILKKI